MNVHQPVAGRFANLSPAAALIVAASLLYAAPVVAEVGVFTDRASWSAAAGLAIATIDFEGLAPADDMKRFDPLIVGAVDFGTTWVADPGVGEYIAGWGTGATVFSFGDPFRLGTDISFSTPVTAFGFDYGATCVLVGVPCSPQHVQLILSDGTRIDASGPIPPLAFVGITSSTPLTGVSLEFSKSFDVVDNFSYAIAQVPEPSAAVLLAIGLATVLTWRSRCVGRKAASEA